MAVDLSKVLARAQLPALPQCAVRLLELSQDPNNGPFEYATPIESDPGLTSQVLRFVNSSYFGLRREVASVHMAISIVGVRTIKNFVLWSAVFSVVPNPKCGTLCLTNLWQDSLRRGLFARRLGRLLQAPDAEDYFAIALLQDIAVPLLAKELPDDYRLLIPAREDGRHRLSDLELDRFGWTHGQAGAQLALKWRLPESFAAGIEQHSAEPDSAGTKSRAVSPFVGLSALLPSTIDPVWRECEKFLSAYELLNQGRAGCAEEVLRQVDSEFTDFAPFMKIAQPTKSLVELLGTSAVEA